MCIYVRLNSGLEHTLTTVLVNLQARVLHQLTRRLVLETLETRAFQVCGPKTRWQMVQVAASMDGFRYYFPGCNAPCMSRALPTAMPQCRCAQLKQFWCFKGSQALAGLDGACKSGLAGPLADVTLLDVG